MAEAKKWKTGNPSDPTTDVGALISKEHLEKVMLQGVCVISSHLLEGYKRKFQEYVGKDLVISKISSEG